MENKYSLIVTLGEEELEKYKELLEFLSVKKFDINIAPCPSFASSMCYMRENNQDVNNNMLCKMITNGTLEYDKLSHKVIKEIQSNYDCLCDFCDDMVGDDMTNKINSSVIDHIRTYETFLKIKNPYVLEESLGKE